jgi:tetratricopeptide (TPR) repeat protein
VTAGGAADRFWSELRAVYQAAGQPTLSRLVHLGLEQRPAVNISDSTISGWLNRKAVPVGRKNERYLTAMLAFLAARAKSEAGYRPLPPGEWSRLLRQAQAERAAGRRTGRPRRPAGEPNRLPGATPGRAVPDGELTPPDAELGLPAGELIPAGTLIGRDRELTRLTGLVKEVAAGRGGVLLVEGEPGIGKSALVRAALTDAAALGCAWFWGTGDELGQSLPLQPLLDALRVRESAGPRRATIVRLLRGEATADHGTDSAVVLAEQLLALVAEQCAARPTILVVDDLQWADQATIRLWGKLARSARQLPLLLIGTMRPVPQRDDLLALRRAAGDAARLPLAGLTESTTAELVAFLVGGQPDDALLRLAGDAAGNPLYITELVAALTRSSGVAITGTGVATLTAGSAPGSLSAAIADRLGFVSGPVRGVLRAAALLGVDFAAADLAIVLGRRVADLLPAVDEACAAGVLTESCRGLGFRHPLIRAALYDEVPASIRAAWHREAGRALAEAGAPADRVARQLLPAIAASDGTGTMAEPMDDWMLSWLAHAAELLVAQAPQVATELLRQAVANSPDGSRRDRLVPRLAAALYWVGDTASAEQLASHALAHAVEPDLLVELNWTLAQCRMRTGESAWSLAALDRALASPGLSARHRARLLVLGARIRFNLGEVEKAGQVATVALAAATEAGDRWVIGWALHVLAILAGMRGRKADALALFDQALAVTQADPALTDLRLLLQINQAVTLGDLDRYEEALAAAGQARQLADQVGTAIRQAQAHGALCELLFDTGRWDDALAEVEAMPTDLKEPAGVCNDLGIAAVIGFHRGEIARARRHLAAAASHAERAGTRLVRPLALARCLDREHDGAPADALAELTDAFDRNAEEVQEIEALLGDAVRLATQIGDLRAAEALAGRAAALAVDSPIPHLRASLLYCRGLLDHDAPRLVAAAECYAEAGRPLQRAAALEAAAGEFARGGDRNRARAAFAAAAEIFTKLGATADVGRLQAISIS